MIAASAILNANMIARTFLRNKVETIDQLAFVVGDLCIVIT